MFCFLCVPPCWLPIREGREELQNVLTAFAVRNPAIGYVNSFSHIAVSKALARKTCCSAVDGTRRTAICMHRASY